MLVVVDSFVRYLNKLTWPRAKTKKMIMINLGRPMMILAFPSSEILVPVMFNSCSCLHLVISSTAASPTFHQVGTEHQELVWKENSPHGFPRHPKVWVIDCRSQPRPWEVKMLSSSSSRSSPSSSPWGCRGCSPSSGWTRSGWSSRRGRWPTGRQRVPLLEPSLPVLEHSVLTNDHLDWHHHHHQYHHQHPLVID